MRERLIQKIPRLLLSLLMAGGLTLTLLGALRLNVPLLPCFALILAETLALEAVTLTRRTALFGSLALASLALLWGAVSGFSALSDSLRALTLHLSGIPGALPLVARPFSLLASALLALLSFLASRRSAGFLTALVLAGGALLLIWLSDRPDLVPSLLPACVAALCVLVLERHPEQPLVQIIPWALALLLLAYGLVPKEGAVIPELKERADSLRQTVMDRLFFTEPREVFSLSSEGFYPQGPSQLGGPVTPSDHQVMQVSAPRTVYLRGVILNEYDGRAWRNTLGGRRFLWDAPGMAAQRSDLFDQALPSADLSSALTEPLDLSVRMLESGASTLFVPQRLRELRAGGELVPYFTNSSEIFATRNLAPGDTWSASAPLLIAGDPGLGTLVDAAASTPDSQYEAIRETYTVLPSHLEEPVWQLATDVTEGLTSPYEKAFALQNYLSRNYRYTLDAAWQPANLDFVTNFLFNTREGYCTYFASALTVLCRMAGLPARYVEGYLAEPNASGQALVTGQNAHAWTEVYFRGFGWLTFDATPHRAGPGSGDSEALSSPTAPPDETPTPALPPEDELPTQEPPAVHTPLPPSEAEDRTAAQQDADADTADAAPSEGPDPPFAPSLLFWLLLLLAGLIAAVLLRWRLTSPFHREKRASTEAQRFDLWLSEVVRRLEAMGLKQAKGETVMGFTRRLDAEGAAPVPLAQLGECASLLHYGKVQALDTDTALARTAALDLRKRQSRKARLRYALRRLLPASLHKEESRSI